MTTEMVDRHHKTSNWNKDKKIYTFKKRDQERKCIPKFELRENAIVTRDILRGGGKEGGLVWGTEGRRGGGLVQAWRQSQRGAIQT